MSNVALYLNPEAFNTRGPALMGRQSAGESFLRGYLRHATVDRFWFWNVANRPTGALDALLAEVATVIKPVTHIPRTDRNALAQAGNVHLPQPNVAREAWHRNVAAGRKAYGISGLTHTTASTDIMDSIANLLLAPIESWDSLICTSSAVRASVEVELEAVRADLENRLGATRVPEPQLVTIPLGINTDDFVVSEEHRTAWRTRLGIAPDAVVVLYVGRFNPHAKMNPVPMAMALERAAALTGKPIAWVQAGWGGDEKSEATYHAECRSFCPSIDYHVVDGRVPETRFTIWSVGDIFISLSDNVQETFGLTPVEAMAAGIPCVVSDWNGYRDTVRHGIDGFRAATYAPAAGTGNDLAYRHSNDWIGYNAYVGGASQLTAVDLGDAARALADLIDNPDLRRTMGEAARTRARSQFDWSGVIPQYEAMWDEMTARRVAAAPTPARARNLSANPRRLDPFHLFGGYATEWLTGSTMVMMTPGRNWGAVQALTRSTMAAFGGYALPTLPEFERMVERLSAVPQMTVNDLVSVLPAGRRPFVGRGLLWLAKYDIITILPRAGHIPS
jgi:glycosyltransferase involved in cell wall biosynthesis